MAEKKIWLTLGLAEFSCRLKTSAKNRLMTNILRLKTEMTANVNDVLVCLFAVTKPASILITRSFEIARIFHFK